MFVPTPESVAKGKKLKAEVEKHWFPPKNYFHLHPGGHLAALRHHLKNSHFVHLDIQNYFGQVNRSRVTRCLKPYFSYDVARTYAEQSTVTHPTHGTKILPFGFVQSPILASLALYKSALGRQLRELPRDHGVRVSVYVDDIILSSEDEASLTEALRLVELTAVASGFPLNKKKQQGPYSGISAFNVKLSNQSLMIEATRLEKFLVKFGETDNPSVQEGIRAYINSVNPGQAAIFESENVV